MEGRTSAEESVYWLALYEPGGEVEAQGDKEQGEAERGESRRGTQKLKIRLM